MFIFQWRKKIPPKKNICYFDEEREREVEMKSAQTQTHESNNNNNSNNNNYDDKNSVLLLNTIERARKKKYNKLTECARYKAKREQEKEPTTPAIV